MFPNWKTNHSLASIITLALAMPSFCLHAQESSVVNDDSTVTYSAAYFNHYEPFSVSDMLDRIPGINVARGGNFNNSGGPGSSGGSERRGLGLGGDQVLINGRRITGKENEGNSQLTRIPANQVERIEIIRGTSGDLDIRGGSQIINIVLLEAESRLSFNYEVNADHNHDGEIKPGAKFSASGQQGNLDYLISFESEPRYEYRKGFETSTLADGSANDTVERKQITDQQPTTFSTNLGYQFTTNDIVHFNAQYQQNDAPGDERRTITNLLANPVTTEFEKDKIDNESDFWEIGGDYEHTFSNGNRWKNLFIINQNNDDRLRERFDIDRSNTKDLYLETFNRYEEKILRSSYAMNLTPIQDIEFGLEHAQTTLDSTLKLGLETATGPIADAFGGLTQITNSNATVEEVLSLIHI